MSENVGEIDVSVHADASGLPREVERAAERASRGVQIEIPAELERGTAARLRAEAERAAERASTSVQFNADADFADLAAKARAAARAAKMRVEVETHLDRKGFIRDAAGMFREAATGAAASLGDLQDALADFGQQGSQANGVIGRLSASLSNLSSALPLVGTAIQVGLVATIITALPFIGALVGALIALAGQVAYAAGALAIGLGGALAAVGVGAVTAMVGIQGLGEAFKAVAKAQSLAAEGGAKYAAALKAQKEALKGLAPSAREFVIAVVGLQGAWKDLQKSVQQRLFAGLGDEVKDLADNLLPALENGMGSVATALNGLVRDFLRWAGSTEGAQQIGNLFKGLAPVITSLGRAVGGFGKGLLTILLGAMPFIQDFAEAIAGIGESFSDWASGFVSSGGLEDFLTTAADAGSKLWDILMNVGSILGSLFSGSSDLGAGLLTTLEDLTGKFADFLKTPEGQEQMRTFFEQVGTAMTVLGDALRIVWPILVGVWTAFQGFLAIVGPTLDWLSQFSGMWEVLGAAIYGVATALSPFGSLLFGIIAGFVVFGAQVSTFFQALPATVSAALSALPGIAATAVGSLVGAFTGLAGQILQAAGNWLTQLGAWFSGSNSAAATAVRAIIGPFSGLAGAIFSAAGNFLSAIGSWMAGAAGAAAATAQAIVRQFSGLAGQIVRAIGQIVLHPIISLTGTSAGTISGGSWAHGGVAGMRDVPHTASGVYRTSGPEVRLIGEAGPEAVVPLTPGRDLDPSVRALLLAVAESQGLTRPTVAPQINVTAPTDDPETVAMAVWNRLVFEGVAA